MQGKSRREIKMKNNNKTFEIGLVGAGAVSAGAYTAGVVDFIVYALDQWYAAKDKDENAPPHDVKISVFSGSSAGGITAALTAGYLASDQPSVTNEAQGRTNNGQNKLFDTWVDRVDIASLLESKDLADKLSPVISLLDSSILSEVAYSGLNVTPRATRRPYVAENFELLLAVTNLRGAPYTLQIDSGHPARFNIPLHADYVRFCLGDSESVNLPDHYVMNWNDLGKSTPVKDQLRLSALATAAFPLGLAPRTLSHMIPADNLHDWYNNHTLHGSTPDSHPNQNIPTVTNTAKWGEMKPNYQFNFQCVDGSFLKNEPVDLVIQFLSETNMETDSNGKYIHKAILMIDPFPNESPFDPNYSEAPDLLKTAISLFSALRNQARYMPGELIKATQSSAYSHYIITPARDGATYPIACAALGGFGGFLKREFRSHDYFLGRRNAQKFLQDHFVLPENNPLFAGWADENIKQIYCVKNSDGLAKVENGQLLLPIIPLVGDARNTLCYQAEWPLYTLEDLAQLITRLESRVDVVIEHLVNQYFKSDNLLVRLIMRMVFGQKKKGMVNFAQAKVIADLKKMNLMK
jgi:hypothetical protein